MISVIIPVYKVEEFLNECIESVVAQTYQNLQIILVDDGSPDRCGEMCDYWAQKDGRIQVIHKVNGGLSDARNEGLAVSDGEYITFVDSDDWVEPQMFDVMLRTLINQKADIVACGIINSYPDRSVPYSVPYCMGNSDDILKMIYQDTKFPVAAWNKLYRRKCWDNFRFPKGKICEDAFTTYLLVDRAEKIVQIPDGLYHYRIRENSIMTAKFRHAKMDEEEAWRCNYNYMKVHHPEIAKLAFDFYLQKVNVLINTIPVEEYEKFKIEFDYLFTILKKNYKYILFQSGMNLKYKIYFVRDFLKLKRIKEIE